MFPPGNASADAAIDEHLRYRKSWFADVVGPLLVPAAAFDRFAAAAEAAGAPALRIILIGTTTTPSPMPPGVEVVGFEVPVPDLPLPEVAEGLSLAAEISPGDGAHRVLDALVQARVEGRDWMAKFRTGGTTAEAFPSEEALTTVVCATADVSVPLKLTAGLHHAVRHTDAATGFEHHGFLNVLLAVECARAGGSRDDVRGLLGERSPARLAGAVADLAASQVAELRGRFRSFGCCGVEDPITDLVQLGLVDPEERS
jgi:hypothetical protein